MDCSDSFVMSQYRYYKENLGLRDQGHLQVLGEVKRLQAEIGRLQAPAASVSDERPVSNPDELPKGFVPLQRENGELVYAACLDGGRYHGWLMWKHPDGQWVTKRKMTSLEVMQAEDQAHYGIVQEAGKENP